MDDLGKVLFELHANNTIKHQPNPGNYSIKDLPQWDTMPESARVAWRATAQEFIAYFNGAV